MSKNQGLSHESGSPQSRTTRFISAIFMGSCDVKRDDTGKYLSYRFAAMKVASKFELLPMQCTNLDKGNRVECQATWTVECQATWTKLQCAFKRTPFKKNVTASNWQMEKYRTLLWRKPLSHLMHGLNQIFIQPISLGFEMACPK